MADFKSGGVSGGGRYGGYVMCACETTFSLCMCETSSWGNCQTTQRFDDKRKRPIDIVSKPGI